jgi:transcriptional regulator with XRE-family HTH domain
VSLPAVAGGQALAAWLRREREARTWTKRETARRMVQAGKDAGDTVPGLDCMCRYIYRWERGENGLTERYQLYYCKAFGIPAARFGPGNDPLPPVAQASGHGLSASLRCESGLLVIEISGLDLPDQGTAQRYGLALVPSPGPAAAYGRQP